MPRQGLICKTIFDSSMLSTHTPLPPPLPKGNATDFCTVLCLLGKTPAIRRQNQRHKLAKLRPKGSKLKAKVYTAHSKFFFPAHQKQSFVLQKIALLLQKKHYSYFLRFLAHFMNFQHTFLEVCCCHETGLKPALL